MFIEAYAKILNVFYVIILSAWGNFLVKTASCRFEEAWGSSP